MHSVKGFLYNGEMSSIRRVVGAGVCSPPVLHIPEPRSMCVCVCVCVCVCPALCDPMECSLLGSYVHGIVQARMPEWVDTSYSSASPQTRDRTHVSCISCLASRFFITSVT